jgi:hypothetical protein
MRNNSSNIVNINKYLIIGIIFLLLIIILVIIKSYKNNYYKSTDVIEGYKTSITIDNNILKSKFDELLKIYGNKFENVNKFNNNFIKGQSKQDSIYNFLNRNSIEKKNYIDNLLNLYGEEVYEELQNKELNEITSKYNDLINYFKKNEKILKKKDNNKIQHIQTGSKFSTLIDSDLQELNTINPFSIVLDNKNAVCLKHNKIDKPLDDLEYVNNINTTACDYSPNTNDQKFKLVKIDSNDKYNNNLYDIYRSKKELALTSTYNNYPFYYVRPTDANNTENCLTLHDGAFSIQPCNGENEQRFLINSMNFNLDNMKM